MVRSHDEQERFCADAYPRLVGALAHHCGDVHLAEELAQSALLKACRDWETVRHARSPVGWCYRVGVNAAHSWFRRVAAERRARTRMGPAPTDHHDPDTADRLAVHAALRRLTPSQREAVILRYFLDLSVQETADALGSTPGAVRAQTHRAVQALRDELVPTPVADPQEATDVR